MANQRLMKVEVKYKIISVILAIVVWFYVMGEQGQDVFFYRAAKGLQTKTLQNVPILLMEGAHETAQAISLKPKTIDVEVLGPRKKMESFNADDLLLFVNVRGFSEGAYELILDTHIPAGIKVISELKPVMVTIHPDVQRMSRDVIQVAEQMLKEESGGA